MKPIKNLSLSEMPTFCKSIVFVWVFLMSIPSVQSQCEEWSLINESSDWSARAGLQTVEINDVFYVLGGRTPRPPVFPPIPGDSDIWNDVWTSQDKGLTWNNILDNDTTGTHWPARAYFQALTKNDSIYILGGQNYKVAINPFDSSLVSSSDFFNDVWVSPDGIAWQQLTDSAGWSGRAGLSSVVFNDEIYVMGGSVNDDAAVIGGPPERVYFNDVWKSADGENWELLTDSASWSPRAGGIAVVKDDYIYMVGGEEGFLGAPGGPPPYFNDIWRTQDGSNWELVTANAPWSARPGHQCVVADDNFVLFGGFGIDPLNPFVPANPIDVWISDNGESWEQLSAPPWNAVSPGEIKYDFDALVSFDADSNKTFIYSFGGDRETFNFMDPTNYLNVDNDVWRFCVGQVITAVDQPESDLKIQISPNPVVDHITIRSESNVDYIALHDLNGKKLIHHQLTNYTGTYELNGIAELPSGIYIIYIRSGNGIFTEKLIKQ